MILKLKKVFCQIFTMRLGYFLVYIWFFFFFCKWGGDFWKKSSMADFCSFTVWINSIRLFHIWCISFKNMEWLKNWFFLKIILKKVHNIFYNNNYFLVNVEITLKKTWQLFKILLIMPSKWFSRTCFKDQLLIHDQTKDPNSFFVILYLFEYVNKGHLSIVTTFYCFPWVAL